MSLTPEQFQILKDRLSRTEGVRSRPYVDTVGKQTIGIGHNLSAKGLSDSVIGAIFSGDIDEAYEGAATLPVFCNLDPIRQTVLVDMVFNMGLDRVKGFRNMLTYLARKDFDGAADEMLISTWAKQVGARAIELATIIRTGVVK